MVLGDDFITIFTNTILNLAYDRINRLLGDAGRDVSY